MKYTDFWKISSIICAVFFLNIRANAQETLTAERAIEIALENQYGLRIAKNEVQIAANNVTKANAGQVPEINFVSGLGFSNVNAKQKFASGAEQNRNFASSFSGNAGVLLNWTIYDGRRMYIAYDRLQAQQKQSENQLQALPNSFLTCRVDEIFGIDVFL